MARIERIIATEVVVPARGGSINSPGIDQPLHKLPVAGRESWTVQFDELPKCIVEICLDNGIVGLGELYRDHDWRVIDSIAGRLVGADLDALPRQKLPVAPCREYDGFECAVWPDEPTREPLAHWLAARLLTPEELAAYERETRAAPPPDIRGS